MKRRMDMKVRLAAVLMCLCVLTALLGAAVSTDAPEGTTAPEGSTAPERTAAPEGTAPPEETPAPEETTAPEGTPAPEETAAPDVLCLTSADEPMPVAAVSYYAVLSDDGTLTFQNDAPDSSTGIKEYWGLTGEEVYWEGYTNKHEWWHKDEDTRKAVKKIVFKDSVSMNGKLTFSGLLNLESVEGPGVVTLRGSAESMFSGCWALYDIESLAKWDVSAVTEMTFMFNGCKKLTSIDLLSSWNVSAVTDMQRMFDGCALTSVNLSGWGVSSLKRADGMFFQNTSLRTADLSNWKTAQLTNSSEMFEHCGALESVNVSGWDTSQLNDLNSMFYNCSSLQTIDGISDWTGSETINHASVWCMFAECRSLTSLDLSKWKLGIESIGGAFRNCTSLTSLDISGWDDTDVPYYSGDESIYYMFGGSSALEELTVGDKFKAGDAEEGNWCLSGENWKQMGGKIIGKADDLSDYLGTRTAGDGKSGTYYRVSCAMKGLEDVTYDGNEHRGDPTVVDEYLQKKADAGVELPKDVTPRLTAGDDYTLTYSRAGTAGDADVINVGEITVTVAYDGDYEKLNGYDTFKYHINQAPVTIKPVDKVGFLDDGPIEPDDWEIVECGALDPAKVRSETMENYTFSYTGRLESEGTGASTVTATFKAEPGCHDNYLITCRDGTLEVKAAVTLTYNANGGSGEAPPQETHNKGDTVTLAGSGDLSRTDAVFLGWSLTKHEAPIETQEAEDAAGIIKSLTITEDTTVYAVWGIDRKGGSNPGGDPAGPGDPSNPNGVPDYKEFKPANTASPGAASAPGGGAAPLTGDDASALPWTLLLSAFCLGLALVLTRKNKT